MDDEEWRPVVGHEEWYAVSNWGRVKRIKASRRAYAGRLLSHNTLTKHGYAEILICKNGQQERAKIHRLVAFAFIGNPPGAHYEINHKDGNKANNHVSNLEWVTRQENSQHAVRLGLANRAHGSKHPYVKLTEEEVLKIRAARNVVRQKDLAVQYNVGQPQISRIHRKASWKYVESSTHYEEAPPARLLAKSRGDRNNRANLTEDQVRAIRAAAGTMSQMALAEQYKTTQTNISLILRRKHWKHLE